MKIIPAPIVLSLPADPEKDCMKRLKKIRYDLIAKHGRGLSHRNAFTYNLHPIS